MLVQTRVWASPVSVTAPCPQIFRHLLAHQLRQPEVRADLDPHPTTVAAHGPQISNDLDSFNFKAMWFLSYVITRLHTHFFHILLLDDCRETCGCEKRIP